jgi:hypothetical protein
MNRPNTFPESKALRHLTATAHCTQGASRWRQVAVNRCTGDWRKSRINSGENGLRGLVQLEPDFQCSTSNFDKIRVPYVDFLYEIEHTSDDGPHIEGVERIDVVRFRRSFWSRDCAIHGDCVGHPIPDPVPAREIRLGSKPLGRHKPF